MEWQLSRDAWDMLLQKVESIATKLDAVVERLPPKGLCDTHSKQIDSLRKRIWLQTGASAIGGALIGCVFGALMRGLFP